MVDEYLQFLANDPIRCSERANKIFLPQGKRKGAERTEAEKLSSLANSRAARERQKHELTDKVKKLLDYYATTSVPFDRIAQHLGSGWDEAKVIQEMKSRGRVA